MFIPFRLLGSILCRIFFCLWAEGYNFESNFLLVSPLFALNLVAFSPVQVDLSNVWEPTAIALGPFLVPFPSIHGSKTRPIASPFVLVWFFSWLWTTGYSYGFSYHSFLFSMFEDKGYSLVSYSDISPVCRSKKKTLILAPVSLFGNPILLC